MPLQAGSWLMSIFEALGAAPSNFTVPLTVATVAGSMGVAAGAAAGWSAIGLEGCSSFLLQAVSSRHTAASRVTTIIARCVFLFMTFALSLEFMAPAFRRLSRGHNA